MKQRDGMASLVLGIIVWQAAAGFSASKFEFGAAAWYFEYKEPGVMTDKGSFLGFHGAYTYRGPLATLENAMLRGEVRGGLGRVDYDGELMDGTPYSYDGVNDALIETRGLAGYDFANSTIRVTPYLGAGYRRLNDYKSDNPVGYDRASNYFYSPLGIETLVRLNEIWRFGGTVEYDLFWFGRQNTWIQEPSIDNDQHGGYGVRGSLRLVRKGDKINFIIEPYIIYWDIETSDMAEGGWEPHNQSTEAGLRLTAQF